MTAKLGWSALLDGAQADNIWTGGSVAVHGVTLNATLTGSLTITGITQSSGQPASWVIPATSAAGYYAPPAAGGTGGALLSYSFSNPVDIGKAFIAFR